MKEKMYWLKKHTYLNSLVIKVLPGHLVITVTTTIERTLNLAYHDKFSA